MRHLTTFAFAALLSASPSIAQTVGVLPLGNSSFAVNAIAESGGTPERAGQLAMERACEETTDRGYTHFGVNEYRTWTTSQDVETQSAGQDYHVTGQGQVYNTPRSAQSRTITKGAATIVGVAMSERVAVGSGRMIEAMQIIDARSCDMVPR